MAAYCAALEAEIRRMGEAYPQAEVNTVFLGGGTPTLLPPALLARVLDALRSSFRILPGAEFTSEGNPGTLTGAWLDTALARGLNRLSLGVQAAQDKLLARIGRIHTFAQAEEAVRLARTHGIRNLNLDVMFGLPGQTLNDYLQTLERLVALAPQHLSAYSLILEEGTKLCADVNAGVEVLPTEEETTVMYEKGIELLCSKGYRRYEISNFALPGYECRHNLGYWQGAWYLGMGVAAHSMLPPTERQQEQGAVRVRRAHGTDVQAYLNETEPEETELIGADDAMFETMMLGLRTADGVSEDRFRALHGVSLQARYGPALDRLAREKLGAWRDGAFALSPRGMEVQNEVLMRFME